MHPASDSEQLTAALIEHAPLVGRIVNQFMKRVPRSVQREDLVAAGMIGLLHALRSTTHTCSEMLAAYARIRIRGAIIDELRRHDWSPRRKKPVAANGPGMPKRNIAACGVDVMVVGFDDLSPQTAALTTKSEVTPLEQVTEKRDAEALHAAIAALPEREHAIVRMRYFDEVTSQSIASSMGLSEARVSQLLARATRRLKETLEDRSDVPLAA